MELMRKAIRKFQGISIYEIKELGVAGFQYKYQIVSDNGIPITEKSTSLDYVMCLYKTHIEPNIIQLPDEDKVNSSIIKQ